jgi:hypothetical protein
VHLNLKIIALGRDIIDIHSDLVRDSIYIYIYNIYNIHIYLPKTANPTPTILFNSISSNQENVTKFGRNVHESMLHTNVKEIS